MAGKHRAHVANALITERSRARSVKPTSKNAYSLQGTLCSIEGQMHRLVILPASDAYTEKSSDILMPTSRGEIRIYKAFKLCRGHSDLSKEW